ECGLSIGAPAPIPSGGGSRSAAASGGGGSSGYGAAREPCPNCPLPPQAGDTFFEGCRVDFPNESPPPPVSAPTTVPAPSPAAPTTAPGPGAASGSGPASTTGTGTSGPASGADPMADLEAELAKAEAAARVGSQGSDPLANTVAAAPDFGSTGSGGTTNGTAL